MPWVITTVSSTPCSKSGRTDRRDLARLAVLLVLAWMLAWLPGRVHAESHEASVTRLRLDLGDDGVYLTAQVEFDLPPLVEDVLEKGIAVYFVAEAELYRERWYWTDRKVVEVERHMRLAYQPLTRRWRLNVSPVPIINAGFGVTLNQNFDTLQDALDAIRRVGRLRLGDVSEIGDEPLHPVTFRFRLDTSQLPRPFQIGVVGQSDWNISAERSARLPLEKGK
jgi:hypothetical protein